MDYIYIRDIVVDDTNICSCIEDLVNRNCKIVTVLPINVGRGSQRAPRVKIVYSTTEEPSLEPSIEKYSVRCEHAGEHDFEAFQLGCMQCDGLDKRCSTKAEICDFAELIDSEE